jgi:hypothetical protein
MFFDVTDRPSWKRLPVGQPFDLIDREAVRTPRTGCRAVVGLGGRRVFGSTVRADHRVPPTLDATDGVTLCPLGERRNSSWPTEVDRHSPCSEDASLSSHVVTMASSSAR